MFGVDGIRLAFESAMGFHFNCKINPNPPNRQTWENCVHPLLPDRNARSVRPPPTMVFSPTICIRLETECCHSEISCVIYHKFCICVKRFKLSGVVEQNLLSLCSDIWDGAAICGIPQFEGHQHQLPTCFYRQIKLLDKSYITLFRYE